MSTVTHASRTARGRAGARVGWLAAVGVGGLLLSAVYRHTGIGLPCPFLTITGWDCPLCGGTRMGAALMRGEVAEAFAFNPVALIGLLGLFVLGVVSVVEWLGGPAVRVSPRLRARVRQIPGTVLTLGWVVPLLGWTVLRNL